MATENDTAATAGPPPRSLWVRRVRLVAVLVVLTTVLAVAAGTVWFQRVPTVQDLMDEAGLIGKRELLVGVKADQPGVGFRDPETGRFQGFDVDIALMIAGDLGFQDNQVRFVSIESEDRARMQARDGDRFVTVDLVVASYSITEEREEDPAVSFSAPYLETEQSVLTLEGHSPVESLADLRGEQICTISTATSQATAERDGVKPAVKNGIGECVSGLRTGVYQAVTTDATILAGFVARDDTLVHHDIGQDNPEAWGVNTGGNEALRTLVNRSLHRSRNDPNDRRWENAFEEHLAPEQPASPDQQVAVSEQPEVPKVRVREWPWESLLVVPPMVWGRTTRWTSRTRARRPTGTYSGS